MNGEDHSERTELLKFFFENVREEVNFLRERQDSIFTWSSNVFIALIGALLIFDPAASITIQTNIWSKLTASLAVIVFIIFSVRWQQRTRRWQSENGQVIWRIEKYLHCFDPGYFDPDDKDSLLPARWNEAENREPQKFLKRVFRANYVSATMLLGVLAVVMIWVRA